MPLGRGRLIFLYACLKTYENKANETHWYYYDTSRSISSASQRIKQISSIQDTSSRAPTMSFMNGLGTKSLNYPPFWMNKLKGAELKSGSNCGFIKGEGTKAIYTLSCNDYKIEENVRF
ncbi:hypothetical protein DNK47_02310 [Mycoplasma wenyonii]|uniref:Uncharacterized protein n=1 Tax=Mycoplasma wenyonii TaxID=65123 RepID=A0A328PKF9_9MOLU|nr:hypothetical protein [Mycoplasma wenyonii]RAO94954.1 hypothetical protein DNK47_02310 [Mycoplasma wenyonii]